MPRTVVVERDYDNESVRSERPKTTTVRRYKVPDRTTYNDDRYETDIKITKRDTERERPEYRDVRYEREVERERPVREYRVTREVERDPSPPEPEYREWRIEREFGREPQRRAPYELERYTRDVEWVREPERPQPIIIRQEAPQPIIIRESAPAQEIVIREERREEPKIDIIETRSIAGDKRSEIDNRSLVLRRDPEPISDPESDEENYYYKRVTRQVQRRPERQDDYDDRDARREVEPRRDVDPRDSVSNRGDDYSDEEYHYRKTTEEWNSRDRSPDHKLHLAEGAAVGLAGAALLQSRRKKDGQKAGGAGQLAGGAALGAVGAELITRARSRYKSRSRSRGGRRRRSRSRSTNNVVKLGAVAALGALAAYAASRNNNDNANKVSQNDRRSRSRRRRSSVTRDGSASPISRNKDMRNSSDRNVTIAKAGLASAAVAGLVERVRSKSRGGRNRSLGRTALPVAAAGLGGAAIAGLYTKNKATQQEGIEKRQSRRRSPSGSARSRSRPRSRSRSAPVNDSQANPNAGNQNLIVYGNDPIPPPDSYARPRSRADSLYGEGNNSGGRDRGSPSSSRSTSPRRDRNRHRRKDEGANGAGISGAAASGASERRQRKRHEREQRRLQEQRDDTPSNVGWGPYAEPAPVNAAYQYQPVAPFQPAADQSYYPQTTNFPPPPPNNYTPAPGPTYSHATYNPEEYSAPGATPGHAQQAGVTAATESQWYPPAEQNHPYGGHYNVSRPDETLNNPDWLDPRRPVVSSLNQPALHGHKSVQCHFTPSQHDVEIHKSSYSFDCNHALATGEGNARGKNESFSLDFALNQERNRRTDHDHGGRHGAQSPESFDSGETIVLPDRFDSSGRRKASDAEDQCLIS